MFTKFVLILAVIAIVATAGTVPVGGHYKMTLFEPAVVQGTVLKAGDYSLQLNDNKLTIKIPGNKVPLEVTVKVEDGDQKYDSTAVRMDTATGQRVIAEIRLGGTKTKLLFQ